jgi:hypothetical protein
MSRVVPSQVVDIIDQLFPDAKDQKDTRQNQFSIDRGHQNEMAAIIELVKQIPSELITLNPKDYTGLQLAITAIRTTIQVWKSREWGLDLIRGYGNLNPVTIIRNALSKCPDEGISKSTSDLTFILDHDFRKNLRLDISSANQAFQNGEWKAATVLAGASIEALLLYMLNRIKNTDPSKITTSTEKLVSNKTFNKIPESNIDKWNLNQLIEVARDIDLIREKTTMQARLAKDFRNLIHPGVSARKKQLCNRGTALSALAALEHVINDLSSISP